MKCLIMSLLALGLISCSSCSSCAKNDTIQSECEGGSCPITPHPSASPSDSTTPPPPTDQVFSGTGWELTVPPGWEKINPPQETKDLEVMLLNTEKHNLILLFKEPFTNTSAEYTLEALRGLKGAGATFVSAKQVELNGNKFVLIESKNGVRMWVWVTVQNGSGFALSCGGPELEDWHKDDCSTVANSLKLK